MSENIYRSCYNWSYTKKYEYCLKNHGFLLMATISSSFVHRVLTINNSDILKTFHYDIHHNGVNFEIHKVRYYRKYSTNNMSFVLRTNDLVVKISNEQANGIFENTIENIFNEEYEKIRLEE